MPLLDHFHPPLRGPRRWEGFHHAWAANIAQHLNREVLPECFFAEPEISLVFPADFARLDVCEVWIYENLGGAQLRAVIELVCPANKDHPGRRAFAIRCAQYLKHAVSVIIIDVVTERTALDVLMERTVNLHADLMEELDGSQAAWELPTHLYAIAYRPISVQNQQSIEAWPETLTLGQSLPTMPLWLRLDLSLPLQLEETYTTTCSGLRISP